MKQIRIYIYMQTIYIFIFIHVYLYIHIFFVYPPSAYFSTFPLETWLPLWALSRRRGRRSTIPWPASREKGTRACWKMWRTFHFTTIHTMVFLGILSLGFRRVSFVLRYNGVSNFSLFPKCRLVFFKKVSEICSILNLKMCVWETQYILKTWCVL